MAACYAAVHGDRTRSGAFDGKPQVHAADSADNVFHTLVTSSLILPQLQDIDHRKKWTDIHGFFHRYSRYDATSEPARQVPA
jgi:hypothetical protein